MKRSATKMPEASDAVIEQAGALCLRSRKDGVKEVLLVGSRRNGRWGLPKGHIDPGEATNMAAAREAFEEAGARGDISDGIAGSFVYSKDSSPARYRVIVHVLNVTAVDDVYPEKGSVHESGFCSLMLHPLPGMRGFAICWELSRDIGLPGEVSPRWLFQVT